MLTRVSRFPRTAQSGTIPPIRPNQSCRLAAFLCLRSHTRSVHLCRNGHRTRRLWKLWRHLPALQRAHMSLKSRRGGSTRSPCGTQSEPLRRLPLGPGSGDGGLRKTAGPALRLMSRAFCSGAEPRSEPRGWRRGGCSRNHRGAQGKRTCLRSAALPQRGRARSSLNGPLAGRHLPLTARSHEGHRHPSRRRRRTGRGRSSRNGPFPLPNSFFVAHRWFRHPHAPAERPFTLTSGRSLRAALTRYVRLRYALPAVRRASRQPTLRARSRVPRFARRRHRGDRSPSDNGLDPTRSRFRRMPRRPHGCVLSRTRGR